MASLSDLKTVYTRREVANLLGYKPQALTYLIYTRPVAVRYSTFTIPKRAGGVRTIFAPDDKLKELQSRLSECLSNCRTEIVGKDKRKDKASHGFEVERSIFTNAWEHKNRRFVLNLDLEDFFPSINFGRVRGFFMKDRNFELPVEVATTLAQIACHNGLLPQGSPCSPVISNMIAHILDVRLVALAGKLKCRYTRYADDITFSTNAKEFPAELASEDPFVCGEWTLGTTLVATINNAGFKINTDKTRMQKRPSHQTVTGLTVNDKVNIRAAYYKQARSKCHSLFTTGQYHTGKPAASLPPPPKISEAAHLEGVLAHIYHIKHQTDVRSERLVKAKEVKDNRVRYPQYRTLYKKFLFFKRFVQLDRPLIICEGKTDNIYLRCALKNLIGSYPNLGKLNNSELKMSMRFLKHGGTEHDILELGGGGSSKLAGFISHYELGMSNYKYRPNAHPVIVLLDNDDGASPVFKSLSGMKMPVKPTLATTHEFYWICWNLYVIKTPESPSVPTKPPGSSCIENLFDPKLLAEKVGGKIFNKNSDKDNATQYGKFVFAEKVVRPAVNTADFSQFAPLFDRIEAVIADYKIKSK